MNNFKQDKKIVCASFENTDEKQKLIESVTNDVVNRSGVLRPGTLVTYFKMDMLSNKEKLTGKYMYEVVGTATHTETNELVVVYRSCDGSNKLWTKPVSMFLGEVDQKKYPNAIQQYKFEEYYIEGRK